MTIKVKCVINHMSQVMGLINYFQKEKWPTEMEARPMKGDLVESESGKKLEIRSITHTMYKEFKNESQEPNSSSSSVEMQPIIEVLLTK